MVGLEHQPWRMSDRPPFQSIGRDGPPTVRVVSCLWPL